MNYVKKFKSISLLPSVPDIRTIQTVIQGSNPLNGTLKPLTGALKPLTGALEPLTGALEPLTTHTDPCTHVLPNPTTRHNYRVH